MSWLIELAATMSFLGLAGLGARVVWLQVQGSTETASLVSAWQQAEQQIERLRSDAVSDMYDHVHRISDDESHPNGKERP